MSNLKDIISSFFVKLRRYRQSYGFGLQSPFAYLLKCEVIYQKLPYYAYEKLKAEENNFKKGRENEELLTLLFRLSNYLQPSTVLIPKEGWGRSLRYIKEGCRKTTIEEYKDISCVVEQSRKFVNLDILCISSVCELENFIDKVFPFLYKRSLIVVKGIHSSHSEYCCWCKLIRDSRTQVTFDLYKIGLIFFDDQYSKQNYKINFPS